MNVKRCTGGVDNAQHPTFLTVAFLIVCFIDGLFLWCHSTYVPWLTPRTLASLPTPTPLQAHFLSNLNHNQTQASLKRKTLRWSSSQRHTALFSPSCCSFSAKCWKTSPFMFRRTAAVTQQKSDLATRLSLCVGVRLKLLKCHRENGKLVTKHGLRPSSPCAGKALGLKVNSKQKVRAETPTNSVCRRLSPFCHHVWVGVLVLFLVNEVIYSYCFFLFCVNIFILMWSEPLDCKCVQACAECTSDRNVSERNYGWKPFLYTDSYFVYLFFFLLCHEIWWRYGHSFICFVPFFSFCVSFSSWRLPVQQQYRKTHHPRPSDVNDSKASHRRCDAKCHVHSMNNIKPRRLFLWSVFVTESVFVLSECSAAQGRWETVRIQD